MTEREKDERDLAILRLADAGAVPSEIAEMFKVDADYVAALIREARNDPS